MSRKLIVATVVFAVAVAAQIQADTDLTSLSSDPRFDAPLPKPEEFEHPFVENVKIIHEFDGEAMGDQFGWIARKIGDVDGDHVADFVTSAPTNGAGGAQAGRIYVYSSKSGKLLWTANGQAGDQLGTGVEAAGDTNRDGIPDVIAAGPGGGKAYIYSGKDGRILQTFTAEKKDDDFGRHASAAGDVDHDGYADVMVNAPRNAAGGADAGLAYVYSGKDGHLLLTCHTGRTYVYDTLSTKPKFIIESDETGNALGRMFVLVLGDVDGDKVPDIHASDWSNAAKAEALDACTCILARRGNVSSRSPTRRPVKDSARVRPWPAMSTTTDEPISSWAHGNTRARRRREAASISIRAKTAGC